MDIRIGTGYDVHRLVEGRDLFIGGVKIPHNLGLLGHSDADVLLHAIMDSILGALAKGDIGKHFPDTSDEFKGIDSKILLARVYDTLVSEGYVIGNVDATIVAQAPKMAPHIPEMIEIVARILRTDIGNINIKATTEEKLGFTGRMEGISAQAVCVVKRCK